MVSTRRRSRYRDIDRRVAAGVQEIKSLTDRPSQVASADRVFPLRLSPSRFYDAEALMILAVPARIPAARRRGCGGRRRAPGRRGRNGARTRLAPRRCRCICSAAPAIWTGSSDAGTRPRRGPCTASEAMTFCSSRTFPGQSYRASAPMRSTTQRRAGPDATGRLRPDSLDQPRHVVRPLAQRRNRDADHVEPETQVGAESARLRLRRRAGGWSRRRRACRPCAACSRRRAGSPPPEERAAALPARAR